MKKFHAVIIALSIGIVSFIVRFPAIGSFMTADEENWMTRSGEYYHDLFRRHISGGAFKTTHPGATGMWIMGAGIVLQEEKLGIDIDNGNLEHFRRAATIPVALAVSIAIGFIAYQLCLLLGVSGGIVAGGLLALDPYLAGLSQIAHLDALLAVCMIGSALAVLLWRKTQKTSWLIIAGVTAGLAFGTKLLPALWILVWFAALLAFDLLKKNITFNRAVRRYMFMGGVAALTFYVLWPALWFTADIGRSFEKDIPVIVEDSHIEFELSEDPIEPATFYLRSVAGRTTPIIFIVALAFVVFEGYRLVQKKKISNVLALALFAIGYLILITYIAKKGDRYALPALASLPVVAGAGIAHVKGYLSRGWQRTALVVVVLGIAGYTAFSWSPHMLSYSSPLFPQNIRPYSQQGWGEGLEEAAAWLNQSPFIDRLYIASWYPTVTNTYFEGKTLSLSARDDKRIGYIVTYRNMRGRAQDDIASNVLDELKNKEPIHTIEIHGEPYVWIYNNLGPYYFRRHVGELVAGVEVGQQIPITFDGWNAIDVAIATFSSRNNTQDVILEVWENIDDDKPIRTSVVNARQMKDEEFQRFTFDPIENSANHEYYVSLRSPGSYSGNAITVRYADEDVSPGVLVLRRNPLKAGEKRSDFIRTGDIGYQIP